MEKKSENFVNRMNRMGHKGIPFLFMIDYEMLKPKIYPLGESAKRRIFYSVNGLRNFSETLSDIKPLIFSKHPVDYTTYRISYEKVLKELRFGNTFLTNLTFPTEIETNWSLRRIFENSNAPYRLLFKDEFVLFSPESFIRIANGIISSYPMKGTIDASVPGAREIVLTDEKEMAEHATIVDLIRNDLSMVARDVTVKKYRYVEEIIAHDKTLLQVSSEISGRLPSDYKSNLGTIITRLLPAGSICGAPKESTQKIIKEAEGYSRGYYTGVFGLFDGYILDSAVMIRYIEKSENKLWYKSGGGITILSNPEKEYRELIDKVYVATH